MKKAIVCNIGHFDNEIQVAELEQIRGERNNEDSVPGGGPVLLLQTVEVFIY